MRHILSRPNRSVLEEFAQARSLVAFDYDGTLTRIVPDPAKANLRAKTRGLLRCLTELYPCTVISGRSRADVQRRLRGTGVHSIVGNHGAETAANHSLGHAKIEGWKRTLEDALAQRQGVEIEDKKLSLAIHYRKARRKTLTRETVLAAARSLPGARLVPAKQGLSVTPDDAPHKGQALQAECARLGYKSALFVGDDDTDEDVFALKYPARLITIRVGARRSSKAAYYLARQSEIDDLIRLLIELRSSTS